MNTIETSLNTNIQTHIIKCKYSYKRIVKSCLKGFLACVLHLHSEKKTECICLFEFRMRDAAKFNHVVDNNTLFMFFFQCIQWSESLRKYLHKRFWRYHAKKQTMSRWTAGSCAAFIWFVLKCCKLFFFYTSFILHEVWKLLLPVLDAFVVYCMGCSRKAVRKTVSTFSKEKKSKKDALVLSFKNMFSFFCGKLNVLSPFVL